jgi:hypothetical protein
VSVETIFLAGLTRLLSPFIALLPCVMFQAYHTMDGPVTKTDRTGVLSEDLFWFGEKMRQGYEGVAPNPEAALNLYKAAAASGFPRAYLRLGEMYERGIGTAVNPREALEAYQTATAKGEIVGYAAMARLASRTPQQEEAQLLWHRFFEELASADTHDL